MFKNISVACLCLMSLFACNKDEPTNVIIDITDDFYIDMFEDISNGEQRFQFEISTIALQDCPNYLIDYDITIDKDFRNIDLVLNDLIPPSDCFGDSTVAKRSISLGYMPSGAYSLKINLKDAVFNQGRLSVFGNQYILEMDSDDGIEVLNDRLYRIPRNTLWGYISYSNLNDAQEFLVELEESSSIFPIDDFNDYLPGYYGYFDLNEDRNIVLQQTLNTNSVPFIFRNESNDINSIKDFVEIACDEFNVDVHFFTEYGLELNCE